VVAATSRRLEEEVAAGRFRQDLLYRLRGATVTLPPLRHRPREVPLLARLFLMEACARLGRAAPPLSQAVVDRLLGHPWPGNLRELRNAMDYVASTCPEEAPQVEPWHLPDPLSGALPAAPDGPRRLRPLEAELQEIERARIVEALQAAGGVQARAAALLAMPLRTFTSKVRQHGLLAYANTRRPKGG
jgi:DNA-binding NtrC family response regulator